jgi:hypothetical protein
VEIEAKVLEGIIVEMEKNLCFRASMSAKRALRELLSCV